MPLLVGRQQYGLWQLEAACDRRAAPGQEDCRRGKKLAPH